MTDQQAQPVNRMDPFQIVLEQTQQRGELTNLAQQLNGAIAAMTGSLQAVQGDCRKLSDGQAEMVSKLAQLSEHSSGLERLGTAIADFVKESRRWQEKHEKEDQTVSDRVNTLRGVFLGFGLLASLLVALGSAYIANEFSRAGEERAAIRSDLKDVQRKLGIVP
jgi:ABC-type transporter Mla subunit MlaD